MRGVAWWKMVAITCLFVGGTACSSGDDSSGLVWPSVTSEVAPSTSAAGSPGAPTTAAPGTTTTGAPGTTAPPVSVPAATGAPAPIDLVADARPAVTARGARAEGTLVTPDGRTRTFRTYVPSGRSAAGLPILVALHGGFGSGAQFELNSGFDGLAEANGFVVVYPDGTGTAADPEAIRTWNGGGCCGPAVTQKVDDVTFISRLIDEVARITGADKNRVVVAGHSNGAIMAHRLSCELAERIIAIGVQSGGLEIPQCTPARPVSVLHIHGGADTNEPFLGGVGSGAAGSAGVVFRPVLETMTMQAKAQGCSVMASDQTTSDPAVQVATWAPCAGTAVVRLVYVTDGTHAWMGSDRGAPALSGAPSMRIDASRVIVSFFLDALARR